MYDDVKLYDFACKTGAINLRCGTTDVSISANMSDVAPMYALEKVAIKFEITDSLSINKGWKWETGYYADYASGRVVATNNSSFPINGLNIE